MSGHSRVAAAWTTAPRTVAIPRVQSGWAAHTFAGGAADHWAAVGYRPHSVYSHLSCDPFPLAMPPGALRGALSHGGLGVADTANAAWCSLVSGATSHPMPVGTLSPEDCAADKTEGTAYAGDQSDDACVSTATAAVLTGECAPGSRCLQGLDGGYDSFLTIDPATGGLVADLTALPSEYGTVRHSRWRPRMVTAWVGRFSPIGTAPSPSVRRDGCRSMADPDLVIEGTTIGDGCAYPIQHAFTHIVGTINGRDIPLAEATSAGVHIARQDAYRVSSACRSWVQGTNRGLCHQYEFQRAPSAVDRSAHPIEPTITDTARIAFVIDPTTSEYVQPEVVAAGSLAPAYATRKCAIGWPSRDNDSCVIERVESTATTNEVGDARRTGSLDGTHTDWPGLRKCGVFVAYDDDGNKNTPPTNCLATLCDTYDGSMPVWSDCLTSSKVTTVSDIEYGSDPHGWPVFRGLPVGAAPSE